MKQIWVLLLILMFATSVYAKGVSESAAVQATTYSDGVLFEAGNSAKEFHLNFSGPGKAVFSRKISAAGPVFINIADEEGGPLPDGLYKYEARAIPSFTISRQESAQLKDRNVLLGKTDPKTSPVSGNFRILNGEVVDPLFEEFDARLAGGAE